MTMTPGMAAAVVAKGRSATLALGLDEVPTVVKRPMKKCPECEDLYSHDTMFCPFDGVKLDDATWTAPTDPTIDPMLGTTIDGRYVVRRVLGEGGTGTVYEVLHATLNRLFAMKVLRADVAKDSTLAARFTQEARATAILKHPHIVSITDFGHTTSGTPYFVMELLAGHTLAYVAKTIKRLPVARAVRIVRQVADALAAAHDAGIVHRDLKPENLFMVGHDERRPDGPDDVRVVDFGAAKIAGAGRMTKTGIVFGTPHYMSPEQASGQPVDHRADIYALGVIMYELYSGHLPFEADTFMGVLTQHMFNEPPRFASEILADGTAPPLAAALEEITLRALAKRPEERFQSMQAVIDEMDRTVVLRDDGSVVLAGDRTALAPKKALAGTLASRSVEGADRSAMHSSVDVSVVPRPFGSRGVILLALGVMALVGLGLVAAAPRRSPLAEAATASPPSSPGVAPSSVPVPAVPSAPPVVALTHLTTSPPFAEIWQGNHRIGTAPMDLPAPVGAAPAPYTVRAAGYSDRSVVVDTTTGPSLTVELSKVLAPVVVAPPKPRSSPRPASPSRTSGELIDPFEAH